MTTRPKFALLLSVLLPFALLGCGETVPAGKTVIILKPSGQSAIHEKGVYKAWGRDKAYFVDQKLKSFTEKMNILCGDDINMKVDVKAVLSFDVTKDSIAFIQKKVPTVKVAGGKFELSLDHFYKMAVTDIIRGSARNTISPLETDDIRPNRQKLEAEIQELVANRIKELGYPLNLSAVLISNIDYPKTVQDMREKIKEAQLRDQERAAEAEAQLAEAQRQVAIEQEKAKVRMIKARAQADENEILSSSLTPEFLMWRQMEVLELTAGRLAAGKSNTVFMMPFQMMDRQLTNSAIVRDGITGLRQPTSEE